MAYILCLRNIYKQWWIPAGCRYCLSSYCVLSRAAQRWVKLTAVRDRYESVNTNNCFIKNYWTLQFACRKLPLVKIKVPVPISRTSERGPGQRLVIKSCFCFEGLTFYLLYCQRFSSLANNKFKYFFYYCMGCIVMNEYYL